MAIKGDFISFTYNGVHSTDLGIVHVSTSDRYTDSLLPTIQDKSVQVPGGDGTYFFGSYYTQRQITVNIAYDEITEERLRAIRRVFGDRKSHPLIFDDEPYKIYYAKVTGTPQLTYIPFQNYESEFLNGTPRLYKGEGVLTFTCYEPFAHTLNSYKYLSQYINYQIAEITQEEFNKNKTKYYILEEGQYVQCTNSSVFDSEETYYTKEVASNAPSWYKYDNSDEWNRSASLLENQGNYDTFINSRFKLYNPGDEDTNFKFIMPVEASISGIQVAEENTQDSKTLNLNAITPKEGDSYICFNSKTNIIEGLNAQGARTGNIYNSYIASGSWFLIPQNAVGEEWYFVPIDYSGNTPTLEYDYLYF